MESDEDVSRWTFRQSADPVTQRHDLTATRFTPGLWAMERVHSYQASFIPLAPGRTRVELRENWEGFWTNALHDAIRSHIKRCVEPGKSEIQTDASRLG